MIDLRFGTLRVFPAGYVFCSGSFASAVICAVYTIGCNGKIAFRLISAAHRRPPPRTNARTDGRLRFSLPFPLSYRFPLTVCRPDDHSLFILSKNFIPSLSVINTDGSYAGSR